MSEIQHLLNVVNRITAPWRHKENKLSKVGSVPAASLDELCNAQLSVEAFLRDHPHAQAETGGWVAVETELPPIGKRVLAVNADPRVEYEPKTAWINGASEWCASRGWTTVSHWQPLPAPPQPERGEN